MLRFAKGKGKNVGMLFLPPVQCSIVSFARIGVSDCCPGCWNDDGLLISRLSWLAFFLCWDIGAWEKTVRGLKGKNAVYVRQTLNLSHARRLELERENARLSNEFRLQVCWKLRRRRKLVWYVRDVYPVHSKIRAYISCNYRFQPGPRSINTAPYDMGYSPHSKQLSSLLSAHISSL